MIFSQSKLRQFLYSMKALAPVVSFENWENSNAFILRHDVDMRIESAYELALMEYEIGIRSTFFFLLTCPLYNVFSTANRDKIREMANLGFEVGLHFDPSIYGNIDYNCLESVLKQEASMLAMITNKTVKSVSLHNPSVHGEYPIFKGFNNAYDPQIFSDDCYLSDSSMSFRGKNPYEFIQKIHEKPIQVLLHPELYANHEADYRYICHDNIKDYIDNLEAIFNHNPEYHKQTKGQSLWECIINIAEKNG